MSNAKRKSQCEDARCGCNGTAGQASSGTERGGGTRREFLRVSGLSAAGLLFVGRDVMAGPFSKEDFEKLIPPDKKLAPEWVKSLYARGERTVYRGAELEKIGMPIGGLCAGQMYLGGDGKLWHWDIFNQHIGTGDAHYRSPMKPASPLDQGFAIRVKSGGKTEVRALDRSGFANITFCGEYPIGFVEYRDDAAPVAVTLEAFSPFIPLNADDSSLPATILRFTVKNTGAEAIEAELAGWLENAVCLHNRSQPGTRRNEIVRGKGCSLLNCSVEKPTGTVVAAKPDIVFEDWNKETYEGWKVEGTAFGSGPVKRAAIPAYQGDVGGEGERVVNSHASAPGNDVGAKDAGTGKLTSKPFTIERTFVTFWIGGGGHKGKTCLNLIVDGKAARTATGRNDNKMSQQQFDVRELKGKDALIEIVDAEKGGWGNIGVGKIAFSDKPAAGGKLEELPDFGTMGLALLEEKPDDLGSAALADGKAPDVVFAPAEAAAGPAAKSMDQKLVGALGRKLALAPGKEATVTFVLVWHFPNDRIDNLQGSGTRRYAKRFKDAAEVAEYVAKNCEPFTAQTRLWHDTWYDSTLPFWFLDRTFLNISILATSTAHWYASDRFWGWEGVGCCHGTCTHVWHYAHAVARLFPSIERDTRERVDLGLALNADSGVSGFRAEFDRGLAVDGQSGTILRIYREHQMSADDAFLKRNWPKIKTMFKPLLQLDGNDDGVLEGAQMNTLDQAWFGRISWLSSLYLAAVRAGEAMAREMGETEFADRCRTIVERGSKNIDEQLFNGEYYLQLPDKNHAKTVGSFDGCEIDQVFGQSWAWQVGLPRVLPEAHVKTALQSLWRCNFSPDVGPWRKANKKGRWYAMAGEAGLIMCTWPKGDAARVQQGFDFYFNECMNGFEYQAAGHMIWEGLLQEGLAVTRAVHDRYHASRRNPWNEVECGDHYARSMASYGVYLAACGYEYHGPKGHLGFAPRLTPEDFRAAFTTAEGWGTFSQKREGQTQKEKLELKKGQLCVKTLAFALPENAKPGKVTVTVAGNAVAAQHAIENNRVLITLGATLSIQAGQALEVTMG